MTKICLASWSLALALAAFVASACGGSVDAASGDGGAPDASHEAEIECVLADGACPEGCPALNGEALDEARACFSAKEVIGCAQEGSGFNDEEGCYVEVETGTIYRTPQLYRDALAGFRACTDDERGRLGAIDEACATAGDGGRGDSGTAECVLGADGTCGDDCAELSARRIDEERTCKAEMEAIGCAPMDDAFPGAVGCQVDLESGKLYETTALFGNIPGFRKCTDEEKARASTHMPLCD